MANNYDNRQQRFPNQGTLNFREKSGPRSPDMSGSFSISDDVLTYILDLVKNGERDIKLDISAWRKLGQKNQSFLSLSIKVPWKVRQEQGDTDQRYSRQQDPGYHRDDPRDYEQHQRRDTPPPQRERAGNPYGEQSSGRYDFKRQRRTEALSQEEFKRGDRMPSFEGDDDDDPLKPPF